MRAWFVCCSLLSIACASEQAGIEVEFSLVSKPIQPTTSADGRAVVIEHGSLALASVELVPCEAAATGPRSNGELGLLHVEGSPTLLGTSAILALDANATTALGTLAPPPGRYCAVRQHFAAADTDAAGLSDQSDVGQTLRLLGTIGGAPFELRTESTLEVETPLDPPLDLELDGASQGAFELGLGDLASVFANVSFQSGNERDDANAVLGNLRDGVRVQRER